MADEALAESRFIIEKAFDLESPERWKRLCGKVYRQIEQAHTALRRLEEARQALDRRLTGARRLK